MNKAYILAVCMLGASFTGCIGGEDLENITTEEETLDAMGEDNMTSLRKEIDDLKATIKSYEMPKVYFMVDELDNDYLFCDTDYGSCDIIAKVYDINGVIEYHKWESTDPNFDGNDYCWSGDPNISKCLSLYDFVYLDVCDDLYGVDQTLTLTVYDNDGNSASASYDYVYSEDLCGPPEPMVTFMVSQDSANVYHVNVVKVSKQEDLAAFSFFLKDGSGYTYVGGNGFGEIAMQYDFLSGEPTGIDETYDGDDAELQSRADNITADDGSTFPVHFRDNDRDGKLSAGDRFLVYGEPGPAEDGWKLDIVFDGDIIGSAKML